MLFLYMKQEIKNKKLKDFLEQMYGKKLSDDEVKKYKDRLVKFFSLLIEIDQRSKRKINE